MDPPVEAHKEALTRIATAALESFLATGSRLAWEAADAPVVSVLLVLHNRAELTLRCLLSLRGSSVPIEIVIVDNASTDSTPRLLERVDGARVARNSDNVGFLSAANQAARLARGEYLLFLNNDCELLPGSLESAVSVLRRDGGIGAVGGKLVLLDGRLQEAGSVVWNDGSCAGYGRGDSPTAPSYMFERDVDYVSGAFLLTPRETFLAVGGFDDVFRPAYYEDADYCLRLWEAGRRVVYDPRAVALHFEFASSASMAAALLAQAERRQVFLGRHAARLARHQAPASANLLAARARHPGRRILFVDDRVPHARLGSGYPRTGEILSSLLRLGHFVTFYPLRFPTEDWDSVYAVIPGGVEVMVGHGLERFEEFRRERQGYYDVVIVSRDHNLRQIRGPAGEGPIFGATPVVYDAEALSCLREVARRRLDGEEIDEPEIARLVREEASLAEGASAITCVSELEAARFRDAGLGPVVTVGHVVEIAPTARAFEDREGVLFVGAVPEDASPNADALVFLLTEILPRLSDLLGRPVPLTIAGVNASARVARLLRAGVNHLGPVEDLAPLYDRARLFVAPTRFAAGLPMKVHHAAAHGLPVVCTSLLATQLGWRDGVELLVADEAFAFARRSAELFRDRGLWERLRGQALARVARECGQATFDAALRTALDRAMGSGQAREAEPTAAPAKRAALSVPSADPLPARAARPVEVEDRPRTAARLPDDRADRIASLERALGDARRDIAALHASASWRITAPLRALHAWLLGTSRRR